MMSLQIVRTFGDLVYIQGKTDGPGIVSPDGSLSQGDAIDVSPRFRLESGVKRWIHFFDLEDGDILAKETVQCALNGPDIHFRIRSEMGHLPQGMDSRIGPTSPDDLGPAVEKFSEGLLEFTLNCALSGLDLPAAKIRTIVFDDQLDRSP